METLINKLHLKKMLIIAFLLFIVSGLFQHQLAQKFWFIPAMIFMVILIVSVIYLIVLLILGILRKRSYKDFLYNFFMISVSLILFYAGSNASYDVYVYYKLPVYEEIVSGIKSGKINPAQPDQSLDGLWFGEYEGVRFSVDKRISGDTKVAFEDGTEIIDNWCALVYDEHGFIEKMNKYSDGSWKTATSTEFIQLKSLFGGDLLIPVKHRKGPWYQACFT